MVKQGGEDTSLLSPVFVSLPLIKKYASVLIEGRAKRQANRGFFHVCLECASGWKKSILR